MDSEGPAAPHVESGEVAAYLDRALSAAERARVEAHLVDCEACRSEVIEVARLMRARPYWQRWYVPAAVAAAAVLLLIVWPGSIDRRSELPRHRAPAVTLTVAPVPIAPKGSVVAVGMLPW